MVNLWDGKPLPVEFGSIDVWGALVNALLEPAYNWDKYIQIAIPIQNPSAGTIPIIINSRFPFDVEDVTYQTTGTLTCNVAIQINVSNVGGLGALSATTTEQAAASTTDKAAIIGDNLQVVISDVAGSGQLTLNIWVNRTGVGTATDDSIRGLQVRIGNGGALVFSAIDSAGSNVLYVTYNSFFSLDTWTHVMIEWDCTGTNKYVNIARNGIFYSNDTISNSNVFLTTNSLTLNGTPINTNLQEPISFYDLWYDLVNPDISLSATRQKFITVGGSPVNLGVNGSLPFGSQPRLFLSGGFSQWKQNKGSAILLDTNSGQSGFFNPNTPDYFIVSPTKPT